MYWQYVNNNYKNMIVQKKTCYIIYLINNIYNSILSINLF